MNRKKRIERHVREAMVHHLGNDETVVATVFGHSSVKNDDSSGVSLIGESEDHHLVMTGKRLFLVELGDDFPAKKNAAVEPASVITSRVRLLDEKIWFATSMEDFDNPRALATTIEINQWVFHPATMGYVFAK